VEPFDAVTMLAVLEHFPTSAHAPLAEGCRRFLKPGGQVIITVPSPRVDAILAVLQKLWLVHGMSLEEHHGYEVRQTAEIFSPPHFQLACHRTFQCGLNNLFVFQKIGD
jgi:2-polyprenyl-3-methyl-5-hydroxy-6-metoxy-1,4-benzoquinol methylase